MIRTIETDYVYSQHDGGWYAEQAKPDYATHGMRYSFRVSKAVYPDRESCRRAVSENKAEWGPWS